MDAGLRVGDSEGIATTPAPAPTTAAETPERPRRVTPVEPTEPAVPSTDAPDTTQPAPGGPVFTLDPEKPPQYDTHLVPRSTTSSPTGAPVYPQLYGEQYVELSGGIFPVYPGRDDVPGCGQLRTTYSEIRGNAFYCFEGDFIAYDDADLLPQLYGQLGPAVIGVVLAHEWARDPAPHRLSGCCNHLHGAAGRLGFAGADRPPRLGEPGAPVRRRRSEECDQRHDQVRDQPGTGAAGEAAHGTAFDRVGAFQDGFINGATQWRDLPGGQAIGAVLRLRPERAHRTAGERSVREHEHRPSQPNDIVSLVVAELNVFWPPLVDGMPELTLSPYDGDPRRSARTCPTAPR